MGDGDTASNSFALAVGSSPFSWLAGPRRYSCEAARHVKWFALLQNVEARSSELVCQRLDRQRTVGLRLLSFVEPFGFGAVAQCEVGRLDESPGEILVAILGVPFTLFLAIA